VISYEFFELQENWFEIKWHTGHGWRDLKMGVDVFQKLNLKKPAHGVGFEVTHAVPCIG
jgi:hypothetical protein